MIVESLVGMLVSKGLDLFAGAVDGAGEKAVEFIEEKTGINVSKKEGLSAKEVQMLKEAEASPELKIKLQEMALEKLKEQNRHTEKLRDTAHESYRVKSAQADKIADQIIKWNLPVIFLLVVINVAIVHFLEDNATLIAIASQVIGIAIGKLFAERQAIVNFFFGSSMGSKEKDIKSGLGVSHGK